MIRIRQLSVRYPSGKGIHNVSFGIRPGEVFGYLGPNGAGKTTTIRCLMGFMQGGSGHCTIGGLDCWQRAPEIQQTLGYLPGEPAFLEGMSGKEFLHFLADLRGLRDLSRQRALLSRFELDPTGPVRRMSKGMRQKLAIVAAFQHDPTVLILDEPTSGLDPLMQNAFIELIQEERGRGKTILMSSHSFEEVDRTCSRAAIIREGRLVAVEHIEALKRSQQRRFILTLKTSEAVQALRALGFPLGTVQGRRAEVLIQGNIVPFLKALHDLPVENLETPQQSLETAFMHYYGQEVPS